MLEASGRWSNRHGEGSLSYLKICKIMILQGVLPRCRGTEYRGRNLAGSQLTFWLMGNPIPGSNAV